MSVQYDAYLRNHKQGVIDAYNWMCENLKLPMSAWCDEHDIIYAHDASKATGEEYAAYDAYFYGKNRSFEVVRNFRLAWLHHIHNNPHHWQNWILINDNPEEGEIILDMPLNYILEMICDWWSFSFMKGDLMEIFNWYDQHKAYMKMSDFTRGWVEAILDQMKEKLTEVKPDGEN